MTALDAYDKLESPGLWRPAPEAQRREVVVSIGNASLIISDMAGRALTHWSLAALSRLNPGKRPALYAPDGDPSEELEIEEPLMIDAIETVRKAVLRRRPRPGRLRILIFLGLILACLGFGIFVLPDVASRYTAQVLPPAKRITLGRDLMAEIERLAGRACTPRQSRSILDRLARRTQMPPQGRLWVLPSLPRETVILPGRLLLISAGLVEDFEGPEPLAGFILAALDQADRADPVDTLLADLGLLATLQLLTTGDIASDRLRDHARHLLDTTPPPPDPTTVLARFEAAQIPSSPWAYARDVSGEGVLPFIEGDPLAGQPGTPLLSDAEWVTLQQICQ